MLSVRKRLLPPQPYTPIQAPVPHPCSVAASGPEPLSVPAASPAVCAGDAGNSTRSKSSSVPKHLRAASSWAAGIHRRGLHGSRGAWVEQSREARPDRAAGMEAPAAPSSGTPGELRHVVGPLETPGEAGAAPGMRGQGPEQHPYAAPTLVHPPCPTCRWLGREFQTRRCERRTHTALCSALNSPSRCRRCSRRQLLQQAERLSPVRLPAPPLVCMLQAGRQQLLLALLLVLPAAQCCCRCRRCCYCPPRGRSARRRGRRRLPRPACRCAARRRGSTRCPARRCCARAGWRWPA